MFSPYTSAERYSPLPNFSWAESREVWDLMLLKDEQYVRDPLVLDRHPTLQSRMRSILFDWLSEVCEVYKLHRDTFYLAIDFVDRYLTIVQDEIPKQQLQLIGIGCLFIASKIEEIYPPKLSEFAYVTDGACTEEEILVKELVILKSLKWDLTPMTGNGWLSVYMQLYSLLDQGKENKAKGSKAGIVKEFSGGDAFLVPGYPSAFFAQIAHLLDLSILDIGSLQYSYSIIAAAALYHFTNEEIVYQCSGLKLADIKECVIWMTPFALAIRDEGFDHPKLQKSTDGTESLHSIQSHTADLPLLEKAHLKQCQLNGQDEEASNQTSNSTSSSASSSPDRHINALLTPPRSNQKPVEVDGGKAKTVPRGKQTENKRRRELQYDKSCDAKVSRKKSPVVG